MSVGDVNIQKDRPAYVRFERIALEDAQATAAQGHFVARDVDMAMITPPGSRDVFKIEVPQWVLNMKQDVRNDRLPSAWMDQYLDAYEKWKTGQAMPLQGTPIKGWGVLSPAQQAVLTGLMILTVEDLAQLNDEGLQRIGMGALDLRTKARAWISQIHDKGPLTLENAKLKQDLVTQQGEIDTLKAQVAKLVAVAALAQDTPAPSIMTQAPEIAVEDLLDQAPPTRTKKR